METKKEGFPAAFWVCACTEIFERLAYYLGRSLILIFVTASVATGGLGLSDTVAANMQSNLTAFSYLLPLFGAVIVDKYIGIYSKMTERLDEGFEDGFQYCAIEETNYSRLRNTNMLERVNSEIRRREKVVRIFPNKQSALRLIGAVLIDIYEEWESSSRQYTQFTEQTKKWID